MLAVFGAIVLYLLLRPTLSAWLGMPLPGLFPEDEVVQPEPPAADNAAPAVVRTDESARSPADVAGAEASRPRSEPSAPVPTRLDPPATAAKEPPRPPSTGGTSTAAEPETHSAEPSRPETRGPPLATRPAPQPQPKPTPAARPKPAAPATTQAQLGELTDLGGERFRSTAGLIYEPLRSEHRIDHVLRHGRDDPNRPVHGVFSGDRAVILAVIDEAWQLAQKGKPPQVEIEEDGDRTVYVIDLGRKIGFMGGQAGKRRSFPPCRHLQLVLERNEVVTAYPVIPQ